LHIVNSEECLWDYVTDSKDITYWFEIQKSEWSKYVYTTLDLRDSMDINFQAFNTSLCYDSMTIENGYKVLFSFVTLDWGRNIYYSLFSFWCSNLFWCIWLRNKQYCILNKQYTKEEYEELVPKIIEHMKKTGEWGEFFPSRISPFGYNETVANEYFPLTKEEAEKKWFKWQDKEYPINIPEGIEMIRAEELPEDIDKLTEEEEKRILNSAIICEVSWKPYRIIKQELEFYKKHKLPLPRRHPDVRHMERMKRKNPRKLYDRRCAKCGKPIKTTYPPDSPYIVYCEECYNKEVYG
jgi:hypothetical protein